MVKMLYIYQRTDVPSAKLMATSLETAAKFLDKIPNIPARRYAIYLGALVLQYKQILNEHKECFHFSPIAALGDIILGIRVCEEMILYTCIF